MVTARLSNTVSTPQGVYSLPLIHPIPLPSGNSSTPSRPNRPGTSPSSFLMVARCSRTRHPVRGVIRLFTTHRVIHNVDFLLSVFPLFTVVFFRPIIHNADLSVFDFLLFTMIFPFSSACRLANKKRRDLITI